jgi:uncharacterized membrane protein
MTKILEKLYPALALGTLLALVALGTLHSDYLTNNAGIFWSGIFTFLHVLSGILWIGLLYYFNIVQIPTMPKIPAELKPAVSKFIAPEALFWFRWAALSTVVTGLIVATLKDYVHEALMLQAGSVTIGIGMWLGLIMAFNVWFIIWPNQKKALGIIQVDDAAKAKAARIAMLTSRTNFVLSLPMLYCMVTKGTIG